MPEGEAGRAGRDVCAAFRGDGSLSGAVEGRMELMRSMLIGNYSLSYFTGDTAPKETLDSLFQLTKCNMERLYNESDFLGGWKDRMKYRELYSRKTHILVLHDDENAAVGFISYRFLIIDDFQPPTEVCYIYELQVDGKWRSRGVGRFLIHAAEIVARRCGARKLMCTVLKLNARAVSFYRSKCGFVDDESDPDVIDFGSRHENSFHVLKREFGDCETPGGCH